MGQATSPDIKLSANSDILLLSRLTSSVHLRKSTGRLPSSPPTSSSRRERRAVVRVDRVDIYLWQRHIADKHPAAFGC